MTPEEATQQQRIHEAIEETLYEQGDLPEGHILSGWIVCFETAALTGGKATAGHFYGPQEMTTWRAMGLTEWVRHTLVPDEED